MKPESRRQFIKRLVVRGDALSQKSDQTLVCIFLRGGADTLNMFVPYADDRYYRVRPTIGIPPPKSGKGSESALKLDDFYAFHPKLKSLIPAYKEGRMSIVQAVGTDNPTGSHFESQDQIEHGDAFRKTAGGGWLARYLRVRLGNDLTPLSAVSIGTTIPESLRGAPGASALLSIDDIRINAPREKPELVARALSQLYGAEIGLLSGPGMDTLNLLKRVEKLRGVAYKPRSGAEYPENQFGKSLKEIARLVKAGVGLEVACVDLDGWDTHFIQGGASGLQAELIETLASGLAAFDTDLLRDRSKVTTLVITEFGRRTYENGSLGTDHGRGFAAMVLGEGLAGGKFIGKWPGLDEEKWVIGPSGLDVIYDYRSVLSEILIGRMGLRDVIDVFPQFQPQEVGIVHNTKIGMKVD
jgi:uncharacterized protein (DUF1501 family)